jgi:hypothetical protein
VRHDHRHRLRGDRLPGQRGGFPPAASLTLLLYCYTAGCVRVVQETKARVYYGPGAGWRGAQLLRPPPLHQRCTDLVGRYLDPPAPGEKAAESAQQLGQLRPFIAVPLQECVVWANLTPFSRQIPLFCLACNGRAFDGCSRRGLWKAGLRAKRAPRGRLTPLAASPDPLHELICTISVGGLAYKLCVDPLHADPVGPPGGRTRRLCRGRPGHGRVCHYVLIFI